MKRGYHRKMKQIKKKARSDMRNFWLSMHVYGFYAVFSGKCSGCARKIAPRCTGRRNYVTRSYSNQEQNQIRFYEEILSIQAKRLEDDIKTLEESAEWLAARQEEIRQIDGEDLRLTALIQGEKMGQADIIAASDVDWAQKARQADGEKNDLCGCCAE